jgi:hypothetical protein
MAEDVMAADVMAEDVNAADADAGLTIQALCNNFLAANDLPDGGGALNMAVSTTCSGTELALFARDMGKVPTDAGDAGGIADTCLGCAISIGCVDDNVGDTGQECEDFPTFKTFGTVAECVAEVQCGVGLTGDCGATNTPTQCATQTTSMHQVNGNQVNNLFCGSTASAACVAETPASGLPGTCVSTWLAGVPAADATGAGGTALGDGAGTKTASGVGNSVLTCLVGNCASQCVL